MTTTAELWEAVAPVLDFFEQEHVDYYLGGSIASSFRGVARATQDADLVADLRPVHAALIPLRLEGSYLIPEDRMLSAIRNRRSFNLIHRASLYKIDVFVMPQTSFARSAMARREGVDVHESLPRVDIATAEDILLHKLDWFERGGRTSDRQWSDIGGIIELQGERLDREYLERYAPELGVAELLAAALDRGARYPT